MVTYFLVTFFVRYIVRILKIQEWLLVDNRMWNKWHVCHVCAAKSAMQLPSNPPCDFYWTCHCADFLFSDHAFCFCFWHADLLKNGNWVHYKHEKIVVAMWNDLQMPCVIKMQLPCGMVSSWHVTQNYNCHVLWTAFAMLNKLRLPCYMLCSCHVKYHAVAMSKYHAVTQKNKNRMVTFTNRVWSTIFSMFQAS